MTDLKNRHNHPDTKGSEEALGKLRKAYESGNLMLYIGAGVSVESGLPTWQNLVLAMYFSALSRRSLNTGRLYPSYLFATAEWHLERGHEPLEITARKLWRYYEDGDDFLQHLWETLYAGFLDAYSASQRDVNSTICTNNRTLEGIAHLCKHSVYGMKGIKGIISYNYDSLLEIALGEYPFQAIFKSEALKKGKMPVYHVHGYVPLNVTELANHDIVFTEDQYHHSAKDPYSWANLVQIQSLSSSTGLMIGLSLSDRNMRRLLDAVSQMPVETDNYALLKEPTWKEPDEAELKLIKEKSKSYIHHFEGSDCKTAGNSPGENEADWQGQIIAIINEVRRVDVEQQTFILEQLGIHPIWYKDHAEIPKILEMISK
jgi:hypothetical protein